MSDFDALIAATDDLVNGTFGNVAALLLPRMGDQYSDRALDPARPQQALSGIFSEGASIEDVRGHVKGARFKGETRRRTLVTTFWISATQAAAIPYRVAIGDALQFAGRPGQRTYAISDLQPAADGSVNLILAIEDATT